MQKISVLSFFAVAVCLTLSGCGTPEPSNIADDADQTAIEQYEATLEADQKAMGAEPPEGL